MKKIFLLVVLNSTLSIAQNKVITKIDHSMTNTYIRSVDNLTLAAAIELSNRATESANLLNKKIAIAILDAAGSTLLITRADGVGPHNSEASRRKAFTALSTKTATLALLRNAAVNSDSQNLNTLPELLLMSGGAPIYYKGNVVGSIGISGGGSPENDDLIAKSAQISEIGISTIK